MEYSTRIYNVYLKYVAPEDIIVYSIGELFMDVTDYLNTYKLSANNASEGFIRNDLLPWSPSLPACCRRT